MDKATVSRVLGSLVPKSVEYCFRLIDQCERSKSTGLLAPLKYFAFVPFLAEMQCSGFTYVYR